MTKWWDVIASFIPERMTRRPCNTRNDKHVSVFMKSCTKVKKSISPSTVSNNCAEEQGSRAAEKSYQQQFDLSITLLISSAPQLLFVFGVAKILDIYHRF